MVLSAQMGESRTADARQGPARRRLRVGHSARGRAARHRIADDRRDGAGLRARRQRARGAVLHRRRRLVARRMARGDQPVRRAPAAGGLRGREQSDGALDAGARAVRRRASSPTRPSGYGIPGITIDGTDPDEIAAAFAWAVERARAGRGPALIELVSMRMCGHAHHDDMLYLGKRAAAGLGRIRRSTRRGYADPDLYAFWSARDPIPGLRGTARRLEGSSTRASSTA